MLDTCTRVNYLYRRSTWLHITLSPHINERDWEDGIVRLIPNRSFLEILRVYGINLLMVILGEGYLQRL